MWCIDIQQSGIAEIRITQELVILLRDQIVRYPVMVFLVTDCGAIGANDTFRKELQPRSEP